MNRVRHTAAGALIIGMATMPWALAASTENTFLDLLKKIQPGGPYSWLNPILGLLFCSAIAALFWFGPKLIGAASDGLAKKGLTVLWALPLLAVSQYIAFLPVFLEVNTGVEHSLEALGGVSMVATLFSGLFLIALEESYPKTIANIWRGLSLGMPREMAQGFWFCVYFGALAMTVPSFLTSLAAAASFGVFASIALYHLSKKVRRTPATSLRQYGNRRLATFAGHSILTVVCLTGIPGFSYSGDIVNIVLQLYLAGIMSFCWLTLCDESHEYKNSEPKPQWTLVFIIRSPMAGCLIWVGVGAVLAATGYGLAAVVLSVTGIFTALICRPSLHATS